MIYFLFALCAFIQIQATSIEDLDRYIEKQRLHWKVPGVAVVIVEGDKIVFAKGYGVTQFDKSQKVSEDTIFQLASVSKTFTSAGVGSFVDEGKLEWDDEIIKHLPGFALKDIYASRYANSKDLLAHRTGLPAFTGDILGILGYSRDDILYRIRYIEPSTSFREKAQYSNIGFFVAGQLISTLNKTSFEEAIKKRLLDPLEMSRTGYHELAKDSNIAIPHGLVNGEPKVLPREDSALFAAAGGVFSTAKDLGNWMIMQLNGGSFKGKAVLKPETIKAMHAPAIIGEVSFTETPPITEDSGFSYGLGWDSFHYQDNVIVEKSGALDGVRSIVTLIPNKKLGIAIVANLNLSPLPEIIRAQYLNQVFNVKADYTKEFKEFDDKVKELFTVPVPKKALPLNRSLDAFTGNYSSEAYGNATIKKEGNELLLLAGTTQVKGTMRHYSDDVFILTWPSINYGFQEAIFTFDDEGKAIQFKTDPLGPFKRVE